MRTKFKVSLLGPCSHAMHIKSITGLLVAVVLAVTAISIVPVPATAVGDGDPVIVSPATHTYPEVAVGWSSPVTIDLSTVPTGNYTVEVSGTDYQTNNYYDRRWITYDGSQDVFQFEITPVTVPGEYYVHVFNTDISTPDGGYTHAELSRFIVVPDPVTPPAVTSVSPGTFYPRVNDGYRDTAEVAFTGSGDEVRVEVRDGSGTVTRTENLGELPAGSHAWEWDGRRDDGSLAPVGEYWVELVSRTGDQTVTSAAAQVRIATGYQWRRVSRSKYGDQASTTRSGRCSVDRDYWSDYDVYLDCWGGRYATARLAFSIPSSAKNLSWSVSGRAYCCSTGRIYRWAARPYSTRYEVKVKVTRWRSYDVRRATISYDYWARI